MSKIKPEKENFPDSRIATFDVGALSRKRHLIPALLEVDVTEIRKLARANRKASLNAYLIKVIAETIAEYRTVAGYRTGRTSLWTFGTVNVSFIVEKELNGKRVPLPLVIRKANEKAVEEISLEIENAKHSKTWDSDIQLDRKTARYEKLYYSLPGFARRLVWRIMLSNSASIFERMGNVSITSLGMFGKVDGWFIHTSIHPVSVGLGSVLNKPGVIEHKVEIREIMNMTILFDHDVTDGAIMARFVNTLVKRIETGKF